MNGDCSYIVDEDPFSASANGLLEDASLVPKYEVLGKRYAQSENTYRALKRKLGKSVPSWSTTRVLADEASVTEKSEIDVADQAPQAGVRDRAEVSADEKKGDACFEKQALTGVPEGWWVGVRSGELAGKYGGTVNDVGYFDAEMVYDSVVRPSLKLTYSIPPLSLLLDSSLPSTQASATTLHSFPPHQSFSHHPVSATSWPSVLQFS